ncbi:MAG: DNA-binding protein WhiA [Lachnospiraceae bacterium]|nr:DNA-binding protein WhiA [Lachnospiraceae bacterium]
MSFSKDVKEELARQISPARHCRIAEIAAIIIFGGEYVYNPGGRSYVKVSTENLTVGQKYFILLEKTFKIRPEVTVRYSHNALSYHIAVYEASEVESILKAIKVIDDNGSDNNTGDIVNRIIIQNTCCKRAFLRGAFMVAGSVTDPNKSYQFEIVAGCEAKSAEIQDMLIAFGIESKHTLRKKNHIVYVKESSRIADILNIMEAHVALMNLENVRILKEMRNSINRKVNCEAANITKTTEASFRQQQDILYIRDNIGFGNLSKQLREVAALRIEYSDASLKELGMMLHPPLGKSGVNHRLRKLSEIADELRRQKEDNYANKEN